MAVLFRSNTDWMFDASLIIVETHGALQPHRMAGLNFHRAVVHH